MVSTRAKKIKFDDDGEDVQETHIDPIVVKSSSEEIEDEDSDEAPEEESTSKAKQEILAHQKHLKEIEKAQEEAEKEKRRQKDLYNKQQQEKKKQNQVIPDILPDDIIQAANNPKVKSTKKPIHKVLDDVELGKQIKLAKLKQIRTISSVKKGPVHVVISKRIRGVPKSEKIINSKDKWLKRKSLNRK